MQFEGILGIHLLLAAAVVWLAALAASLWWRRRFPGRRDLSKDVLAVGGLALLCAGFFWRLLFTAGVWVPAGGGDFASFYYPLYAFGVGTLHAGQIPLWNPYLYGGMPFAADVQTAVFYPVNLIFFSLLGGFDYRTLELLAVLHYFLAAAGCYALCVSLGSSRIAGIIGGTVFAFSGFMVSHLGHVPMLAVAAWLPFVILAGHQAFTRRSISWSVATGLILSVAILAGHAQISLYVLFALVIYWLFLTMRSLPKAQDTATGWNGQSPPSGNRERIITRHWLESGGILALVIAIGVAGSAIQLLPSYELSQLSVRSAISYEDSTAFAASPVALATLFLPHLFGDSPTTYWGDWMSTEVLGYAGLITLILAVIGVVYRRGRVAFFLILAVAGLLLSLGGYTILHGWFYEFIPGFGKMRSTGRMLILFDFGIAILAAFGTDGVLDAVRSAIVPKASWSKTIVLIAAAVAAVAGVLLFVVIPVMFGLLLDHLDPLPHLITAIEGLVFAVILLLMTSAVLYAAARRWLSSAVTSAFIIGILVIDLFSAWSGFNITTSDPTANFQQPQALQILQSDKDYFRIDSDTGALDVWQPSLGALAGIADVSGLYDPLQLDRYSKVWEIAKANRSSRLYDFLNVKYVIAPSKLNLNDQKFQEIYEDKRGYKLYRNTAVLPRALVVQNSTVVASDKEALVRLQNPSFDPTKRVLLDQSAGKSLRQPVGTSSAEITAYSSNRIQLTAETDRPGYLVLSEVYYPGWKAYVDGKPVPLLQGDYAFRAVYLKPGKHSVTMSFESLAWQVGLGISSVAWAGGVIFLLLIAVWHFFFRRRTAG